MVPPPAKVSCDRGNIENGIRWRNNQCGDGVNAADFSSEVDWLGFFRAVAGNRGGSLLTLSQLQESKSKICENKSATCGNLALGWVGTTTKAGWYDGVLEVVVDETLAGNIKRTGQQYGVNNDSTLK